MRWIRMENVDTHVRKANSKSADAVSVNSHSFNKQF